MDKLLRNFLILIIICIKSISSNQLNLDKNSSLINLLNPSLGLNPSNNLFNNLSIFNLINQNCKDIILSPNLYEENCQCTHESLNFVKIDCDEIPIIDDHNLIINPFISISKYTQRFSNLNQLNTPLFKNNEQLLLNIGQLQLNTLDISNNKIKRLLSGMFNGLKLSLNKLNLESNLLGDNLNPIFSTNEFNELNNLKLLNLANNNLKNLDSNIFNGLNQLNDLNLSNNKLSSIPALIFKPLNKLAKLNIGNNLIIKLDNNSFTDSLSNLIILNLTLNRIEYISPNTFTHLHSLTELYLNNNYLKEIKLIDLNSLEILDLSENNFRKIPNELYLKNLRKLSLAGNKIQRIEEDDFIHLTRLEYIDLSKNQLRSISDQSFQYLNDLRQLNLATNSISKQSDLNFNLLRNQLNLDILDLSDNKLTSFPSELLINQKGIKQLFLDYNYIEELNNEMLENLSNLEELSIGFNQLTELKDGLFFYNSKLRILNFAGNKISNVKDNVFIGCSDNLIGLDLSYNDFESLPKLVLPKLMMINFAFNQLKELSRDSFINLPSIIYLNISNSLNNEINILPSTIFDYNRKLEYLDISKNNIESIENGVFRNLSFIKINLSSNKLKELDQSTFEELRSLENLDLSNNQLEKIENGAFDSLSNLKILNLNNNKLTSFKSELFTTKTSLEKLNLCKNEINYLYPNSFTIHHKLKVLLLCENNLNYFSNDLINTMTRLEHLDLSFNKLKSLDTNNFANLNRLKRLSISNNELLIIGENVFHNLISLNELDLSSNLIHNLDTDSFYNLLKLNLNLENNQLNSLDDALFNLEKVAILNELNLANNNFTDFPIDALRKQSINLISLNISSNLISHLPANTDLLINLKRLDISSNPLNEESIKILFTEPKSIKELNVANVKINNFKFNTIEAPFLINLNLSGNRLSNLNGKLFEKLNLLEILDLSSNHLSNNLKQFNDVWLNLPNLKVLNLAYNQFKSIEKDDFINLSNLNKLDISNLDKLNNLDCKSIGELNYLKELFIYNYTNLKNLEIQDCMNSKLNKLYVEIKSSELKGHLSNAYSTKLNQLFIFGPKLTKISSNFLYGIRSKHLDLTLYNTSVKELPLISFQSSLKCDIKLNIISSNEFLFRDNNLNELNNKQLNVKIDRLMNVTLSQCDCKIVSIYRLMRTKNQLNLNGQRKSIFLESLINQFENLICSQPNNLIGLKLSEIDFNELVCLEENDSFISSDNNYTLINKDNKIDLIELSTSQPNNKTTINYNLNHHHHNNFNDNKIYNQQDNLLTRQIIKKNKQNLKLKSNDLQTIKNNQINLSSLSFTKADTIIIASTIGCILFILILMMICCFGMRIKTGSQFDPTYYFNYANNANLFTNQQQLNYNQRNQSSLESNCTCMKASCHQLHQTNNSPYNSSLNNSLLNNFSPIYQQQQQQNEQEQMHMFYMK